MNPTTTKTLYSPSSRQSDTRVVALLTRLQRVVLGSIAVIAALTLVAWVIPPLGHVLPRVWMLMNPSTLGCALLGALSMSLSQPGRSPRSNALSRIFAVMVTIVSGACLIQDLVTAAPVIHTQIATLLPTTERMTAPIALAYLLIGIVVCYLRNTRGWRAVLADLLTVATSMLMLILTSGYLFDSGRAFGGVVQRRIAPEELVILLCLTFAVFSRRAEYGAFSILLASGIGGATARIAAPVAVGLPLLMGMVEIGSVSSGLLSPAYVAAVVTAIMSLVAFCLVLLLARHAGKLEGEINELSLRDSLTGLYNRRSFFLLAEHTIREARRDSEPFSLLLIGLDGLQTINESLGMEAGSELLQRMALILNQNFREADVTARLSGDNFVIAGRASSTEMAVATYRLLQMVSTSNERVPERPALNFSYGHVTSDHSQPYTLEALLERANNSMCDDKRSKRNGQGLRAVPSIVRSLHPVLHDHR